MFFEYGDREVNHLKSRDKLLAWAIDRIGHIHREVDRDLFSSVIHSIISQQISSSAQATVWRRLTNLVDSVDPVSIYLLDRLDLQGCGMTFRKADYIKDFAKRVVNCQFNPDTLNSLPDEEVIKKLTELKGIGKWTAEMIMIFSMQRPDIISFGDLGIHRGMKMLYNKETIDRAEFDRYVKAYSPYGTTAGLYIWAIAGGAIPELNEGKI
ncbi:DNA-3-methyladenine glycosylase [Bacillota bacterium]